MMITGLSVGLVATMALLAAWYDGKDHIIPNGVSLGGIFCGFLLNVLDGNTMESLTGFLSASILIVPYLKGWLGGGDVKLMMAYGTLLGPSRFASLCLWASMFSLLWLALACTQHQRVENKKISFAIPLAAAALLMCGRSITISAD